MNKKIPVVWGLDEKYILQAFVVMHSVLKHSNEEFVFVLITADDIAERAKEMEILLAKEYQNFEIEIIHIDANAFDGVNIFSPHLSKAAYFRLLIPEVLKEYDKCIYLDCDVIVNGDLKELYDISIKDYYIAGVKDCHVIHDNVREQRHQEMLGLPSRETYINSGVMLMNLNKLRRDGMKEKFLLQAPKDNWNEDQDVLNVCCYGAIKVLPLKYNLFQFYLGGRIKNLFGLPYTEVDFDFAWKQPYILHTGGEYKAWADDRFEGAKIWWELAKVFADTQPYQEQKRMRNNSLAHKYDFNYIMDICDKAEAIAIWGYTNSARALYDALVFNGVTKVVSFVDNNETMWGTEYKGVAVRGMSEVKAQHKNVTWIVVSVRAYKEIKAQLVSNGENEEQIFHFLHNKPRHYYLALSPEYYEQEVREIGRREYVEKISDLEKRIAFVNEIINNPLEHWKEYMYLYYKYRFDLWLKSDVY